MSRPTRLPPRRAVLGALLLALAAPLAACGTASIETVTITAAARQAPSPPTSRRALGQGHSASAPQRPPTTKTTTAPGAPSLARPHIIWDPIPFGAQRKAQMVAYARRHYGSFMRPTYKLIDPHVIVIHYTETPNFQSTFNTFATDVPDPELHELPNTCAHFVIDRAGGIHQLVPRDIMCRHTVGLNWTAIGIEHVGYGDAEVLDDTAQMRAGLMLVRWLRCTYGIRIRDVIGHNESLTSPYHREDVPSLRTQTHSDFDRADMNVYRRRLAAAGGC